MPKDFKILGAELLLLERMYMHHVSELKYRPQRIKTMELEFKKLCEQNDIISAIELARQIAQLYLELVAAVLDEEPLAYEKFHDWYLHKSDTSLP